MSDGIEFSEVHFRKTDVPNKTQINPKTNSWKADTCLRVMSVHLNKKNKDLLYPKGSLLRNSLMSVWMREIRCVIIWNIAN